MQVAVLKIVTVRGCALAMINGYSLHTPVTASATVQSATLTYALKRTYYVLRIQ